MAPHKSPLLGYNHNLKYRGRVYHVQTEDSGLDNPHIFTHLFHDGSILRTAKQEYRDLVGHPDWEATLRGRMQAQHKDMMKELIKGGCDDRIIAAFGVLEAEVEEEIPMATLPPPPKRERSPSGMSAPLSPPALVPAPPLAAVPGPPSAAWPSPPATAPLSPAAVPRPSQALPAREGPMPGQGGVVVSMPMVIVGTPQPGQPETRHLSASWSAVPTMGTSVPSAQFRPEESKPVPDSIFGSELISEKSLDEVILAYLAEDMMED